MASLCLFHPFNFLPDERAALYPLCLSPSSSPSLGARLQSRSRSQSPSASVSASTSVSTSTSTSNTPLTTPKNSSISPSASTSFTANNPNSTTNFPKLSTQLPPLNATSVIRNNKRPLPPSCESDSVSSSSSLTLSTSPTLSPFGSQRSSPRRAIQTRKGASSDAFADTVLVMKEVLDKRKQDGRVQYLVRWNDDLKEWVDKAVVDANDGTGCVYLFQQRQRQRRREEKEENSYILHDS